MAKENIINVLVVSGSNDEALQFVMIARELLKRNILIHIAATRAHVYKYILERGWERALLLEIKKPKPADNYDINEYIFKYKDPTIAEMLGSEQAIKKWRIEQKFRVLAEFLNIYESYFDENNIHMVLKFPTCSFAGRAAFAVAKRRDLPALIINTGPVVSETFTLNDIDEGWLWSEFFDVYDSENRTLSSDQIKTVDETVDKVITDKNKSLTIKKPRIKSLLMQLVFYVYHRLKNVNDYIEENELIKYIYFFWGFLRPRIRYTYVSTSKPYIFFPLHIPWDAQIATRNPMFYSQEAVIEMLARSCPPGVNLYIKEHPYYSGGVNNRMLNKIKKIESVKVLNPSITSLEVIKNASLVVTINSTAGWEAILLRKPLVVLGNPYYAYYKYAYKVENINDLPKIVNKAFIKGSAIYDDTDEWYKFLYSAVSSARRGSMVFYKTYMGLSKDLSDQRIRLLSDELENKIREIHLKKMETVQRT